MNTCAHLETESEILPSCTSLCRRGSYSFHLLYSYYLQWAWASSMPMPPKWLKLKSLAISHHCRSLLWYVKPLLFKGGGRERGNGSSYLLTLWSGAWSPGRTAKLPSCGHGTNSTHIEAFMREANWFFPHHIIKVDIMYVGMYNLNCIYDGEWEMGKMFY